jgi:GNAT superfamily N-acetyltransferase
VDAVAIEQVGGDEGDVVRDGRAFQRAGTPACLPDSAAGILVGLPRPVKAGLMDTIEKTVRIERTPDHATVARVLRALSSDDRHLRFGSASDAGPHRLLAKLLRDPAHRAYIAYCADEPVGLLDYVEQAMAAEFGLVVLPAYRRRGIGRSLVAALIDDCARAGRIANLFAYCERANRPIVQLLSRLGFKRSDDPATFASFARSV